MAEPAAQPDAPSAQAGVAIIGGGPAGLAAAECLLGQGLQVDLYDAMPSVGRKFLLAGKGGLNLTHSEPLAPFIARYAEAAPEVGRWLQAHPPQALRDWAQGLGVSTFVGSSGRVFPAEMKAAPLLRAWLHRLRAAGLRLHMRHRWLGWQPGDAPTTLRLAVRQVQAQLTTVRDQDRNQDQDQGQDQIAQPGLPPGQSPWLTLPPRQPRALLLALGGGSWPQLGSDGHWVAALAQRGVSVAPLRPANCGFDIGWSAHFRQRHAGAPIKPVRLYHDDGRGPAFDRQGEFVITDSGIEGSLVYAASARLREAIARDGQAHIALDLLPGRSTEALAAALAQGRGARSLPNHLKAQAGLSGAKAGLLRERWSAEALTQRLARDPAGLAADIKAWPLTLRAPRPLDEAISSAGGVALAALDSPDSLMLRALPGVFCAGEMLDWEAPTGGYLLSACWASGRVAAQGLLRWLAQQPPA